MEKVNMAKLKQAVNDFNRWQEHAVIMFDKSDGDIWTDIFTSDNNWNVYHSNTIILLLGKDNFLGRDNKVSFKRVVEMIKEIYTTNDEER